MMNRTKMEVALRAALSGVQAREEWAVGEKVIRHVYAAGVAPICVCDSMGELSPAVEAANARFISAASPLVIDEVLTNVSQLRVRNSKLRDLIVQQAVVIAELSKGIDPKDDIIEEIVEVNKLADQVLSAEPLG